MKRKKMQDDVACWRKKLMGEEEEDEESNGEDENEDEDDEDKE